MDCLCNQPPFTNSLHRNLYTRRGLGEMKAHPKLCTLKRKGWCVCVPSQYGLHSGNCISNPSCHGNRKDCHRPISCFKLAYFMSVSCCRPDLQFWNWSANTTRPNLEIQLHLTLDSGIENLVEMPEVDLIAKELDVNLLM